MTKVTITFNLEMPLTDIEVEDIKLHLLELYLAENVEVYQHGIKVS